jgi:hypothetical protein
VTKKVPGQSDEYQTVFFHNRYSPNVPKNGGNQGVDFTTRIQNEVNLQNYHVYKNII